MDFDARPKSSSPVQKTARDFATERGAAEGRRDRSRASPPDRARQAHGRARLPRHRGARAVRRRRLRSRVVRARDGGDLARVRVDRRDHERQQLARVRSDLSVRHRRAEAGVADAARAAASCSAASRCQRARGRLATRPRRRPTAEQRRRRLGHQRHEELDHERPGRRRLRAVHDERQGGGPQRHHRVHPADEDQGRALAARPTTSSASAARKSCADLPRRRAAARATPLLGEVGGGFKVAMSTLDGGRIGIAAQALGIARAALEDALALRAASARPSASRSRSTRRSSSSSPTWRPRSTRRACSRCARRGSRTSKLPYGKEAAMAKLFASDVANRAAREAIQIFGGNGYVDRVSRSSGTSATRRSPRSTRARARSSGW